MTHYESAIDEIAGRLQGTGRASSPYVARQGTALGRQGRVRIRQDHDGEVWVGHTSVTRVEGALRG